MGARSCPACGTPNEADARFCEGCGTAWERRCGACGQAASATARFCRACGASLDESPTADGPTRKTVTVLFADLAGSTAFEEVVDAETARTVVGQYHDLLRITVDSHRAGVTKYIGDGFMAVWGVPEIGVDDAWNAVDAAVELQERFVGLATRVAEVHRVDLALRVAVNTGEVVVGARDADLVGDALNVAARLESQCPHGQVVVGEETWRATRGRHRYESLGVVAVKGRSAPVAVYQWQAQLSDNADAGPFVSRDDELRRIRTVFDEAVAARAARLVTVIGDPGVGKSRLASEFVSGLTGCLAIDARCAVEGTLGLAPIVEAFRTRNFDADIPAHTPERDRILRDLTGMAAGVPASVEETFWALRRYVEVLGTQGPLVVVLDDIQWADSLLVDLVGHLLEWVQGVPVLLLALARPEIREARPDLVAVGGWVTEAIRLRGLDAGATTELATHLLGGDHLPPDLLARLPSSTGGNPLFVRELVGMLVHDGVLVRSALGWRLAIDVEAISIPPTIQALLASRLERLNAAERRVLEVASVIGIDFSPAAVSVLAGVDQREIAGGLARLHRLELAQPSGTYVGDEPVWRFHHVLIRDMAYRRLLKSDRADLHARLADYVESGGAIAAFESDDVMARHLEAAHGYRCDLNMRDARTSGLALRSARSYLTSARRALDRDELISAGTQAARGAILAADDPALQAELLLVGCEAFLSAGDVAAGASLVDDLERIAGDALAPWAVCYRCHLVAYTDPTRLPEVDERLQGAIDEFTRRGDMAGLAKAHRVRANARARLGRVGDCEGDLFQALIAARKCGDHRQITAALGAAPNAALWGPSPAPKAGGRCLDVVRMQRMTTAAPSLEATSLRCLAVLELLRGRPDKARSMLADARQVVADLGLRHGLIETELFAGVIELMVGDPVASEPHFRVALEGLDALGVGADAGQAAALLARSVLAQGRIGEADRYAAESERIAGHNLKTAIAWRAVRAEILSAQGQHGAAIAMACDAVAVAEDTDLVLDHADACMALSRVLTAAGDRGEAARVRHDAESLYAAKDAAFLVGRIPDEPDHPTPMPARHVPNTRLRLENRASRVTDAGWRAMLAHDPDSVVSLYSPGVDYDDRRRLSGDPIEGIGALREAARRNIAQYPYVEWRTLAVRGDSLVLSWARWWDDSGNEATTLHLYQVGEDNLIEYHGRFDEDDFEAAYRELEERYYAGEAAAFAESGRSVRAWLEALWALDVEAARHVTWPDFRWLASAAALKPVERSVDEFFCWLDERSRQVASMRIWSSAIYWMSSECNITLSELHGFGANGEEYLWTKIHVCEYHDSLVASVREFEAEDEDAAFAYAESLVAGRSRRLLVSNAATRATDRVLAAFQAHDAGAVIDQMSARVVYEDRRPLAGALKTGIDYLHESVPAMLAQYDHFEGHTLAVRGNRLCLAWSRWSDGAGNEVVNLHLAEVGDDGRIVRLLYFDDDDFCSAYRELDDLYYEGEGAAYASQGCKQSALVEAMNRLDVRAARELCRPEFQWCAPTPALAEPVRTIDGVIDWWRQRAEQLESLRNWISAIRWMTAKVAIAIGEARGIAGDGAEYSWSAIYVSTLRTGLVESVHGFELEDEDAAFAFADSLVAQGQRRLTFGNRASELADRLMRTMEAHDVEGSAAVAAADFVLDDRRRLTWERQDVRRALGLLFQQFNHFGTHMLAVRGEMLYLGRTHWFDDAGNEGRFLSLFELADDGRLGRWCCFDDDDFWSAYEELEQRYYAGEGAQFAISGLAIANWVTATGRHDLQGALRVSHPEFRWIAPPTAFKAAERTVEEMFEWMHERGRQVADQRNWVPVLRWLSPTCAIGRGRIVAVGDDGEEYNWDFLVVSECRDGLVRRTREFDVDDEDAAFAYAESLAASGFRRLSVSNQAAEVGHRVISALRRGDIDTATQNYSDHMVNDDHRRLSGDPISDPSLLRVAFERIAEQFNRFELRTLAVRGQRLHLASYQRSDDGGNQSTGLVLSEIDEDGRIVYDGRFDEEDFATAYRELERRYYTGEGAPNAEAGAALTQLILSETRGDLDAAFSMFSAPGLSIESRSRSLFPSRTPEELRRSVEELGAMVQSYRIWGPSVCWLSREWMVGRHAREAVGRDGERYLWTRIYAGQIKDGLFRSLCEFDADDEDAAFAYAEERMRAAPSRLAVRNRASETASRAMIALQARDVDSVVAMYSDEVVHEAHRHFTGGHIVGLAAFRAAVERLREQYSRFELQTLAVRGDRLHLAKHCWSDEAGNESHGFLLAELDDTGRVVYHCIFDERDFDSAYRALEDRYFAGEGTQFAENGRKAVSFFEALDSLDVEAARRVCRPDFTWFTPAATLTAQERSLDEFFGWCRERAEQVSSIKNFGSVVHWLSPALLVAVGEVRATGTDGEQYARARMYVGEFRDGLLAAMRQFDDEESAFDYAEAQMRSTATD